MTRKPPSPISEFGPSSPTTAKINWIPEKVLSLIASVELVKITSDLGKTDWASVTELWSQEHFSDALNHTKASLQRKLSAQYAMKDRPQKSWSGIPRTLVELDLKYPDLMSTFRQRLASTQGIASKVSAPEYLSDNINVQTSFEAIDESVDETIGPDCIGIDFIALTNSFRYTDEFQWREPVIEIPRVEHDTMLDHQADESIHLSKEVVAKRKRQILHECRETWNTVPYTPIKESEAHILQAPLLFRFYDLAAEHVENSPREKGFVAGFFKNLKTRIPEPLPCQLDMLFVDFLKHINKEKFPSKVISTSSDFIWVLCQALCVLANNSNPDIRMSIIDAHKAAGPGGKKLYHALPYTRQLRKRRAFDEGKWLYHKNEIFIWGQIQPNAIVSDFAVKDFLDLLLCPRFSRVFHPDILSANGMMKRRLDMLKATSVDFDQESVEVLADTLIWLYIASGDGALPCPNMLQQLVETLVGSLSLKLETSLTAFNLEFMGFIFVHALQKHFVLSENQQWLMLTAFVKGAAAAFRVKNLSFGRFVTSARS